MKKRSAHIIHWHSICRFDIPGIFQDLQLLTFKLPRLPFNYFEILVSKSAMSAVQGGRGSRQEYRVEPRWQLKSHYGNIVQVIYGHGPISERFEWRWPEGVFCWVVMLFWLEGVWLSQVDLIEENSRSFTFNPQVQSSLIHQSRLCVKGLRPKAFNTFDILHFGCCISSPFSHANVSSGRCNPRDISTQEIEAPESNCSIYAFTKCNGFERSSDPQLAI